ncbi:hypothetical protein Tco_1382464 [Tanacetum coccineum]
MGILVAGKVGSSHVKLDSKACNSLCIASIHLGSLDAWILVDIIYGGICGGDGGIELLCVDVGVVVVVVGGDEVGVIGGGWAKGNFVSSNRTCLLGDLSWISFEGNLFMIYVAASKQYPQKWFGKCAWNLSALVRIKQNPQEKRLKPGKHEHKNGRARKKPESQAIKVKKSTLRARGTIQVVKYTLAEINVSHEPSLVNPKKECHIGLKEAQRKWQFTLVTLSKEAQTVSITDCQAGNPCEIRCDPTTKIALPIIERMYGQDWRSHICPKRPRRFRRWL